MFCAFVRVLVRSGCVLNCTTLLVVLPLVRSGVASVSTCRMSGSLTVENARELLEQVPVREYFEVPGKPDVIYEIRDYSKELERGAESARSDLPFLFKPFEVGQKPPPTKGQKPPFGREPTIHEYLDWTVTAASNLDSLVIRPFHVLFRVSCI